MLDHMILLAKLPEGATFVPGRFMVRPPGGGRKGPSLAYMRPAYIAQCMGSEESRGFDMGLHTLYATKKGDVLADYYGELRCKDRPRCNTPLDAETHTIPVSRHTHIVLDGSPHVARSWEVLNMNCFASRGAACYANSTVGKDANAKVEWSFVDDPEGKRGTGARGIKRRSGEVRTLTLNSHTASRSDGYTFVACRLIAKRDLPAGTGVSWNYRC